MRPLLDKDGFNTHFGCGLRRWRFDLARQLAQWPAKDGLKVDVTGIDPDPRVIRYVQSRPNPDGVRFLELHSADLARRNSMFEIILSNHVLHHIEDEHIGLRDTERAIGDPQRYTSK